MRESFRGSQAPPRGRLQFTPLVPSVLREHVAATMRLTAVSNYPKRRSPGE